MVNRCLAVLGALLVSIPLQAQIVDDPRLPDARWGMSLGYNRTPVLGIALTGFAANELRAAGMPLRGTVALDVLFSEDGDSPYYRTSAYNGVEGCHDARDGHPVDDGLCIPALDLAGRAELMAVLGRHWGLGGGARVTRTSAPNPYGLVRFETPFKAGRSLFGQISAGDQFTQVDAGIVVRF